ncbi:MAG TPA: RsiV family protein, partial [Fusibacter sp.]|nr:RsiV family protein [Fusibacter sp.]
FDVALNGDLLTIHKSGYDYPTGAAHGMPISEYYQFDIKTGKLYALNDLFVENSRYIETLDEVLVDSIQKSYDSGNTMVFPESFNGLTEDANFIITKDALIIYFYPYDIAAYAAGFQEFSIPYEDLMSIIDVDGALWNSFEH